MTPIVAVVGRPNVGKSTLFNRLAGQKLAIVDDAPGVTRDRHYADAHLAGRNLTLVDTGGFDLTSGDPLQRGIARQVQAALEEADLVICVLDGSTAPTGPDREAIALLRKSEKRVLYVANKVDNPERALAANELYALGIPDLILVSALHGRGTAELGVAIAEALPPVQAPEIEADGDVPRIALIGRPNAGKSSLFNRLTRSERALVHHEPGTTRDPVDARFAFEGREFSLVDTAGIRRKSRVERGVELVSVLSAIRAIERAQVVVLLCDASGGVAEQDARLLGMCVERRRAVIVGLNKADLLSKTEKASAEQQARDALAFARFAPLVLLSAKSGAGVGELMRNVAQAADEFTRRVPTAELNRFFSEVLERNPPPTHQGRAPRLYYITQAESSPPLFVAMCNAPEALKESYKRFVQNQIRKNFGFGAVPVTVFYKRRPRRERAGG